MFQTVIPNRGQPIPTTKSLLNFEDSYKCIFRLYKNEGMNEDLLKSLLGYSGFLHIRKHPKKQKVDHKIVTEFGMLYIFQNLIKRLFVCGAHQWAMHVKLC